LAEILPLLCSTRSAISAATPSLLRGRGGRAGGGPLRWRSTMRRTVLWVVPQRAAVAR